VLAVNKSDREGSDRTVRDLTHMLDLRGHSGKQAEIVKTVATTGGGIDELMAAIDRHRERTAGDGDNRALSRASAQLTEIVRDRLAEEARRAIQERGGLESLAGEITARRRDPYSLAEEIVGAVLKTPPG
jgi:LAO/AO transport system kinase